LGILGNLHNISLSLVVIVMLKGHNQQKVNTLQVVRILELQLDPLQSFGMGEPNG
jgi:hypothetical protein